MVIVERRAGVEELSRRLDALKYDLFQIVDRLLVALDSVVRDETQLSVLSIATVQ